MSFSSARESSPLNLPRLPPAYHQPISDTGETMNSDQLVLPFSPPSSNILTQPHTSLVSPMSQSCKNPYRY
jgi:hypothetical protein